MLLAGAWAVQVGTATLIDPSAPVEVARGVSDYLKEKRFASPADLRGRLRMPAALRRGSRDDMIPRPENPLVVALDVSDPEQADALASSLAPHVGMLKVGLELFWSAGPEVVQRIASHAPVFADAKLHDIPNTVERASANIARLGVRMFNVHALGGEEMMRAARSGAERGADGVGTPRSARARRHRVVEPVGGRARESRFARVRSEGERSRWRRRVGRGRARRARRVRRRVLSRRPRHPARGRERARPGARADARGRDRARAPTTSSSVGRSPTRTTRSASRVRSSARRADPRDAVGRVRTRRQRSMFALCRARGGAYTRRVLTRGTPGFSTRDTQRSA